jgi:hypothetical protein
LFQIGLNSYDALYPEGIHEKVWVTVMGDDAIIAAKLGKTEDLKQGIQNQIKCPQAEDPESSDFFSTDLKGELANRLSLREGFNATGAERLGNASYALHEALCQSNPPAAGEDAVIRVFPAWPADWNAQYRLLCRGGFMVSASFQDGETEFVEIESPLGGECRIRNPWGADESVVVWKNGEEWQTMDGSLLTMETKTGDILVLVKPGIEPEQFRRVIVPGS